MCDKHAFATEPDTTLQGSRRRRVWELAPNSRCPLVGVALPLPALRKLVERVAGGKLLHDDYDIHVGAVSECALRNPLSEAIQKELERRYTGDVARFRAAKTTQDVGALWAQAVAAGNVPGAFWAGLSHPRCTTELEQAMCRDIHMVQHQAGACVRADMDKYRAVVADNARLARDLARQQGRCQLLLQEKTRQADRFEQQLMAARALAVAKDTDIHLLRSELAALQAEVPELDTRKRLANRLAQVEEREAALRAQVAALKAARTVAAPEAAAPVAAVAAPAVVEVPVRLVNRSVLCVGGRSGSVPVYRNVIERIGAQFAHHDGGLEDSAGQLDASLAAADLVICQTGCISHHAYWRVKDHCKRTGKQCVFIDNPSVSSLVRGLQEMAE
ncbi:DUF2325 domain-containing protein [Massilia yuzhufengensis]|uniref:DUF2325 domain-containing protein n=1 Tax=Massilia yuzhufengensis TaxID=1164594 RepID=A0A1I1IEQ0_9BURK|nr:DUF2325 domain-containing protein [Massilia yuzhufengensis]SFC34441.1 hypothetical protein SAMN05216204_105179 [Massilia yuzhufengensis]